MNDWQEQLRHMFEMDMLNEKGLIQYIKILKEENMVLKCKIIDLESKEESKR